jgi:hypothetical protein
MIVRDLRHNWRELPRYWLFYGIGSGIIAAGIAHFAAPRARYFNAFAWPFVIVIFAGSAWSVRRCSIREEKSMLEIRNVVRTRRITASSVVGVSGSYPILMDTAILVLHYSASGDQGRIKVAAVPFVERDRLLPWLTAETLQLNDEGTSGGNIRRIK